jgi:hypothetical protein
MVGNADISTRFHETSELPVIHQISSILVILSLKVKGTIDHRWRALAKWPRIIGAIGCFGFFLSFIAVVE